MMLSTRKRRRLAFFACLSAVTGVAVLAAVHAQLKLGSLLLSKTVCEKAAVWPIRVLR